MNNLKDLVLSLIEAKPFAVVTDDEQWVTITRHFTVDPERYVSTSYKPPKKGVPKPPPAAVKAVKPVTAPTRDEAIAQDIASCEATAAECRAANPLYCPYHGTMIIQEDIRQRMVAAGVRGNINVDMDDAEADKETGKGFTVTVTCPREQAGLVQQQLQAFLQTPGITINEASLNEQDEPDLRWDKRGDGNSNSGGITMYYDVDTLMADQPPANAAVLQEGNAQGQGESAQSSSPSQQAQPDETQAQQTPEESAASAQAAQETPTETDPVETLVSTLGEGQREFIQEAIDSYRETGKFHAFPMANAQLERQFKAILGEDHPLFGNGQQQGQEGQTAEMPNTASQETETQQVQETPPSNNGGLSDDDITDASEELSDAMGEFENMDSISERIRGIMQNGVESDSDVQFIDRAIDVLGEEHPVSRALHEKTVHANAGQEEQPQQEAAAATPPTPPNPPTPPEENNEPQAQAAGGNPPDNPPHNNLTDADIDDAVSRIASANPAFPEEAIRAEINRLRTGEGVSQLVSSYADQAAALLGEDHPVMRALREQTGNANAPEQTPQPSQQQPENVPPTQEQPQNEDHRNRSNGDLISDDVIRDAVSRLRPLCYTQPLYFQPHQLFPYLHDFLRNGRPNRFIRNLAGNAEVMSALGADHPVAQALQRIVDAQREKDASFLPTSKTVNPDHCNAINGTKAVMDRLTTVGNKASNFPDKEEWKSQLTQAVGLDDPKACIQEMLAHPERAQYVPLFKAYTEHGLAHPKAWTAKFMGVIESRFPHWDKQVAGLPNAAVFNGTEGTPEQIAQAVAAFDPKRKGRSVNWKQAMADNRQTVAADQKAAREAGLNVQFSNNVKPLKSQMKAGCNCWKTVLATLCRLRGFDVTACAMDEGSLGTQRVAFAQSQTAMSKAYESFHPASYAEAFSKMDKMANGDPEGHPPTLPYPNGTFLMIWNGGHCNLAVLQDGKWDRIDAWNNNRVIFKGVDGHTAMYRGTHGSAVHIFDPNIAEQAMQESLTYVAEHRDEIREWGQRARQDPESVPENIVKIRSDYMAYKVAEMRLRRQNPNVSQQEIIADACKNGQGMMHSSFVIKPTDPLIREIFQLTKPAN